MKYAHEKHSFNTDLKLEFRRSRAQNVAFWTSLGLFCGHTKLFLVHQTFQGLEQLEKSRLKCQKAKKYCLKNVGLKNIGKHTFPTEKRSKKSQNTTIH